LPVAAGDAEHLEIIGAHDSVCGGGEAGCGFAEDAADGVHDRVKKRQRGCDAKKDHRFHCAASSASIFFAKCSRVVTQAPGPSNMSRSCSAPSPCRSSLLWVSSTSVVPLFSAVNRISSSLALLMSMSATQSGLSWPGPTCQERQTRHGGSH